MSYVNDCNCHHCTTEREKEENKNWTELVKRENARGNNKMNEARQKREEFRAKLAEAGFPEHTTYSSKVLEAYDKVHCPELRKKKPVVSFNTENYPDGIMITIDGLPVYQK